MKALVRKLLRPPVSYHRRQLNREVAGALEKHHRSVELGAGAIRRGVALGARWTVDHALARRPSVVADVEHLPFRTDSLDAMACLEVLQYTTDPLRALQECARVLTVGGVLLASVPMVHAEDHPFDRWRLTGGGFRRLLQLAGFHGFVVRLTGPGGVLLNAIGWRWAGPKTVLDDGACGLTTGWVAHMRKAA